ncbi:MAG: DnaJ C-terminal domain-containing protein, partial [Streptosporangiaceae bacterium]
MTTLSRRRVARWGVLMAAVFFLAVGGVAQVSPDLYAGLQWRSLGPHHGGRVAAVAGVIGRPGTFYVGLPQGGIFETTSGGMTWFPIFDQMQQVSSIGAIAVAPSDPNIIYAGSGDAVEHEANSGEGGDGMYKSTDGGKTWRHIGLDGTYKIPRIIVDPRDPNLVLVAALSGRYGSQRGVFRSEDGGKTWSNALQLDAATGARDLASPFDDPDVIFATTFADGDAAPCPDCKGTGARAGTAFETCAQCHGRGQVQQVLRQGRSQFVTVGVCPVCRGSGRRIRERCKTCKGRGQTESLRRIEVQIPAGVDNGTRLRLAGQGVTSPNGGPPGDLYVRVEIEEAPGFRREGTNLYSETVIPLATALLGGEVPVRTLAGEALVKIPAGTQPDREFRVKGEGVPRFGGGSPGDLFV